MTMPALPSFMFPPPPSLFISAITIFSLPSFAFLGISEVVGKHMQYSKFWNVNSQNSRQIKLSSKSGMLLLYTPAFLAAIASFGLYPHQDLRFVLLCSALAIHFFKRVFEVLIIHKYSSAMILDSAIVISLSYFLATALIIYAQHLVGAYPEPPIDLKFFGALLFLIGISGNFYHHYLLSKLREGGNKEYKIPKGGIFDLVICPHYLFEIIAFLGISFIAQTTYAFAFTIGSIFYLMGRSYATRKWYLSKFEDFPKGVKALIPYVF